MKKTKEYIIVVVTNMACALIIFLYNVLMRRVITPYEMGIYTSINLIISYLNYAQAGVLNAYNRDYPQLLGGKNESTEHYKNTVFTYIVCIYLIITAVFIAIGVVRQRSNQLMGLGLIFCGIISGGNALFTFYDFTLKSNKNFFDSAGIYFAKTVTQVIFGMICIKKYGYIGIYIGLVVSLVVMCIFNIPTTKTIKFTLDKNLLRSLVLSGFLLLANSIVWTIMQSIDRFVILNFLNMEQLGIYSVALMGFSTMVLIPQSLSQIFYVKMSRIYGKNHNEEELLNQAVRFTSIIGCITSITVVVAYFSLPIFIELVMPMYTDCIKSTQYIVLGVAVYGTTLLFGNVLSVLRKNFKLIITTIILCFVNLCLSSGLILFYQRSIESVAIGTSLAYGIYAIMILRIALCNFNSKFWKSLQCTVIPVGIVCISLIFIDQLCINTRLKMVVAILVSIVELLMLNWNLLKTFNKIFRRSQ